MPENAKNQIWGVILLGSPPVVLAVLSLHTRRFHVLAATGLHIAKVPEILDRCHRRRFNPCFSFPSEFCLSPLDDFTSLQKPVFQTANSSSDFRWMAPPSTQFPFFFLSTNAQRSSSLHHKPLAN